MTLIFGGIDFPVFEMLFIVSILLIVGLKEFEKDIGELEEFEGKTPKEGGEDNPALKKYIKDSLGKGFKWEQIKKSLIQQGWKEGDLDKIHSQMK